MDAVASIEIIEAVVGLTPYSLWVFLRVSLPIQLTSYCAWKWFKFSQVNYLRLSTFGWMGFHFWILCSERLKYLTERASRPPLPPSAWGDGLRYGIIELLLLAALFVGTPLHIGISIATPRLLSAIRKMIQSSNN
jgi:hypothetical protein